MEAILIQDGIDLALKRVEKMPIEMTTTTFEYLDKRVRSSIILNLSNKVLSCYWNYNQSYMGKVEGFVYEEDSGKSALPEVNFVYPSDGWRYIYYLTSWYVWFTSYGFE
jgi:hypothetical protein